MINPAILAVMIPIIAIVMGIGIAMLTIYLGYRKRKDIFTLVHQERMAAMDKGIELPDIPEAFFLDDAAASNPRRDLLKGLIWLFVGAAGTVAVYANGETRKALFGLIPMAIGLAYLIYYFVEGRKQPRGDTIIPRSTACKA